MGLFTWLETSSFARWVGESLWGYPLSLSAHSIGMGIMVGIILVVNLRLAGCFSSLSLQNMRKAIKIAWWGFVINAISGAALFTAQASYFITHKAFLIKIIAIALAAFNTYVLQGMLARDARNWDAGQAIPSKAKNIAIVSILLWSIAIIAGRLIAYVGG